LAMAMAMAMAMAYLTLRSSTSSIRFILDEWLMCAEDEGGAGAMMITSPWAKLRRPSSCSLWLADIGFRLLHQSARAVLRPKSAGLVTAFIRWSRR
jgi:hypothetical protein